jgi:hypothetical protein
MSIRIVDMKFSGSDQYVYLGDENTDGSWRLIIVETDLSIQKRESGVWVEKSSFTP